jgi:hypothetical protein
MDTKEVRRENVRERLATVNISLIISTIVERKGHDTTM